QMMLRGGAWPQPDGPSRLKNSQSATVKFTLPSATLLSKAFPISVNCTSAITDSPSTQPEAIVSTLHRAGRHAVRQRFLNKPKKDDNRKERDHHRGHERAPLNTELSDVVVEADRHQ